MPTESSLPLDVVFSLDRRIKSCSTEVEKLQRRIFAIEKYLGWSYADELGTLPRGGLHLVRPHSGSDHKAS
jgi:hypothetical protein